MSFQAQDELSNEPTSSQISKDKLIRIRKLIESHFNEEINYKKLELETIDDRIFQAKNTLDKLRVCIVCKFYSLDGNIAADEYKNHPTVRQLKCEHLELAASNVNTITSTNEANTKEESKIEQDDSNDSNEKFQSNCKQFNVSLSVGNVSKYLKASTGGQTINEDSIESSQYNQDLITHKWMIYIRSSNCPKLESYIKKVIFYLHSSYKPYDVVEVKAPPFQLIRRGWGEFPTHVQIHFKDTRNKRVDVNHLLKLDWTQTGLQTFGGETTQEIQLILKQNDYISTLTSGNNTTSEAHDSKTNSKEFEILNNHSLLIQNETNKEEEEPVVNESKQEASKPASNANASLNDLFNLRPKLAQPINSLNTTTVKTIPILINNNEPAKINENSTKMIASKLGLNSLLTTKIASPIVNQIILSKSSNVALSDSSSNKSNSILNRLQGKLVDDKQPLSCLNKTQIIYKVDSFDAKANKTELESKPTAAPLARVASTNESQKRKQNQEENLNEKKHKTNNDINQVTTNTETNLTDCDLKTNQLIYSVDYLAEKCSTLTVQFESLIRQNLKYFPLVLNFNIESASVMHRRKLAQLGFCARTLNEFYSWPYAKRKANEWLRALHLKRFILDNCDELMRSSALTTWSTKQIVLYLRSHGHTPLENQHINKDLHCDPKDFQYVSSLTPINRLIKKNFHLEETLNSNLAEIDEHIDILTADTNKKKLKKENNFYDDDLIENNENKIEMCQGSKYIREQIEMLNIRPSICNLLPSDETKATQSNVFTCNLVEKLLFAVCKRFADDLIRQTCSDLYFSKNDQNKLSGTSLKNYNRKQLAVAPTNGENCELILNQKFPTHLSVIHIYNTIRAHDKYDFLTNKYMASTIRTTSNESDCNNNNNNTSSSKLSSKSDVNSDTIHTDQLYKINSKRILTNK